ncbi:MAG TPA: anthranilate synthase component I family protein, partial [Candidatus Polarisedimenticolia bacterium]|nr:anthranilate synthase component I family protein [Candidatus Polarisedimenticolia bacterium]
MDTPGYSAFRALAAGNGLVPVYRSLAADCLTPVMAHLATAARSRRAFLLESIEGGERIARYSFLGRDPWITLSARDGLVVEREGDRVRRWRGDLLDRVRELLFGLNPARLAGLPRFTGGAVGYLAYDAVRGFERLPGPRRPSGSLEPARRKRRTAPDAPPSVPDAWFGLFDTVLAFDHLRHRILLITSVVPDRDRRPLRRQYAAAGERLDRLARDLSRGLRLAPGMRPEPVTSMDGGLTPQVPEGGLSRRRYAGMVRRAQERIRAGDIYQVVLSQSFKRRLAGDPFAVYRALRRINPSPYMYFLRDGRVCLAGASPEMLVRVEDQRVELHPIAGTRPRGSDPEEDAALEAELRADAKEKAEHVMLVDLGRNDL